MNGAPKGSRTARRKATRRASRRSGSRSSHQVKLTERAVHGIVRWRRVDLQQIMAQRFGVAYHERTIGKILDFGFSHVSARPRHPAKDEGTVTRTRATLNTHRAACPESRSMRYGRSPHRPEERPRAAVGAAPFARASPPSGLQSAYLSAPCARRAAPARRSPCPTPTARRCNSTSSRSRAVSAAAPALLLDRAGWHTTVVVPNILVFLPSRAPGPSGRASGATLERQAARGQGPTERQRFAAIALLKRFDPEIVAGALADHIATLTPEKVERIHRDARGREKDST